jgi:LytS/YehU family sensor histidine kinase
MTVIAYPAKPFFQDKNRAFWTLQGIGWAGAFLLRTVTGLANGNPLSFLVPILISTMTGYSLTLLMAVGYRLLLKQKPIVTWTASILIALIASGIAASIDSWVFAMRNPLTQTNSLNLVLGLLYINVTLFGAWSALYYAINFFLTIEEQGDQLIKLESQASAAQLAMLRYQLNPHFLFNTLNSISTLVLLKQTERANAMLSRLSAFLRYTLINEPTAQVTLAQEVETLKLYLEIEKMRFEDRLRPSFNIDPAVASARLPSLLLQPLVENAIKYAVTPQEEGADITVTAQPVGENVRIVVSDTGPGLQAERPSMTSGTGVGLPNIRERLVQAFGDRQSMETRSTAEGGFSVIIEIPLIVEDQPKVAA